MRTMQYATRSPILSHVTASLQGITTVRAFGVQEILKREFDDHQNLHISACYLSWAFYYTLGFWVDLACTAYVAFVIFSFIMWDSQFSSAYIGLAIIQSMDLLGPVQFVLKRYSRLDNHMTSVERILEYTEIESEKDEGHEIPPEQWPDKGSITFYSVNLRYSVEGTLVLKEVSFHINGGEKIGIVGRTGAGKTSITHVLFRLFQYEGKVVIDGVDITSVPLADLRSKLSIIPQEPVFFLGTLRKNLDPFDQFTDIQLWNALEEVEMKKVVEELPCGLEFAVSEGGSNFSIGQRQLLCLVRVILKSNKILILDEATANVDLKTDAIIQSVIKRKFRECTVITIAHRLHTLINSDKILVMDDGKVVQFEETKHIPTESSSS